MSSSDRINPYSTSRRRFASALPWVFIVGVTAGVMLFRQLVHWPVPQTDSRSPETELILKHAGSADARHSVDVLWTIDGDTFEARVHLSPGLDVATRVRLRGIDAPEFRARCVDERAQAEAARDVLRTILDQGEVRIAHVALDKYGGRVIADAFTQTTPDVAAALLETGVARRYGGGRRDGWCR